MPRPDSASFLPGYALQRGSELDRVQLTRYMQRAYQELGAPAIAHLEQTVQQHFCDRSPLWWALSDPAAPRVGFARAEQSPAGCLWLGTAVDQWTGSSQAYVLLLYVEPQHRRRGLATALMAAGQAWALEQGHTSMGLQVFTSNLPAQQLYNKLGYSSQALWMTKPLA
ncbi:MAG: GNAT family N-acetyltransferase [Leptolyngbya sp. SIO4C1]|nr:GNAT family N-acetyltransferase [Leptolyngbya sp. SIO4C1]